MSYAIASIVGILLGTTIGIVAKRIYCRVKCGRK